MKITTFLRFALTLGLSAPLLQAQLVPGLISYQGKITDSSGVGLGDSAPVNRKMIFRIYDNATGGNRLWSEEQTVTLVKGDFSVILGQGIAASYNGSPENPKPSLLTVFGGTDRYLELVVDGGDGNFNTADTPITPRQRLIATAFAIRAATADAVTAGSDLNLRDANTGLGWYGTGRLFNGTALDGPVLYGANGGILGSVNGATQNTALQWNNSGNVGVGVVPNASFKLDVTGNSRVTGNLNTTGTLTAGTLSVTGNSTIAGSETITGALTAGSITSTGSIISSGIRLLNSPPVTDENTGGGAAGNYLGFAHLGFSEDYIGYRNNTFYFKDTPGGGDTADPSINVGGNGAFAGSVTAGSLSSSGGGSFATNVTINNGSIGAPTNNTGGGGMRLTFWPGNTADTPFGMGIDASTMFSVVPGSAVYKWYSGTTERMKLDTGGNLTTNNKSVPVAEEQLRILRGVVNEAGVIQKGTGFTAARNNVGNYTITITTPFSDVVTPVASIYDNGGGYDFIKVQAFTTNSFRVEIRASNGALTDRLFCFIVVGPR
jgi:hypothetical protein